MTRKKLQGQVAIITGGGRGIGAAAAEQLAQAGAAVVLAARTPDQVEAVAARLRKTGAQALGLETDISDPEQVEEVIEATINQFDRVDIVVNNAGIVWPIEEISETDPDEWAYNIHVNLIGPFYMARNVLPLMLEQRHGRILNISSGAAMQPIPGASAYSVAKAGLDMLTRAMAQEVTGTGVTVNALYPGMVDTEMQSDIRSVDTSESRLDFSRWDEAYTQKTLAAPSAAARLIYWLVGPWSRDYSGEIFKSTDQSWLQKVNADLGA